MDSSPIGLAVETETSTKVTGSRLLEGKRALILGVANERSLAWYIGKHLSEHGANCGFSCLPGDKSVHRARKTMEAGGLIDPWVVECDASSDADLDRLFEQAGQHFGGLEILVHSIAYADRQYLQFGRFAQTPRDVFAQALDISAYSLIAIAQRAVPLMPAGGSILALSYFGSEKVIPGYNVMGVAKSALETSARYLAAELGSTGIRVNTLSAGPCRTLSAMAVGGIDDMFEHVERKSPLKRNIEADEVGKTAVYLLSDLSSGVTGENLHVDAGYNIIGL